MSKLSFSQVARLIKHRERGFRDIQMIHPSRDWAIGLSVALMFFVSSAIWAAKTYIEYRSASVRDGITITEKVVVYRESLVETALTDLQDRQLAQEGFKKRATVQPAIEVSAAEPSEENVVDDIAPATDTISEEEGEVVENEVASTSELRAE